MSRRRIDLSELKTLLAAARSPQGEVASVALPERASWPQKKVVGIVFRDVDFNSPLLSGGLLGRVQFEACRFFECDWGGLNAVKTDFVRCEFQQVKLGGATLASLRECTFQDCVWTRGVLRSVQFSQCEVTGGRLDGTPFSESNFREGKVTKLVVTGQLRTVNFIQSELRDVDFSGATLADTSFVGCRQENVVLPDNPRSFYIPSELFLSASEELRPLLSARGFKSYSELAGILGRTKNRELVDEELFEELTAADREHVLGVLYRRSHGAS